MLRGLAPAFRFFEDNSGQIQLNFPMPIISRYLLPRSLSRTSKFLALIYSQNQFFIREGMVALGFFVFGIADQADAGKKEKSSQDSKNKNLLNIL
jgi:hypothetical protein